MILKIKKENVICNILLIVAAFLTGILYKDSIFKCVGLVILVYYMCKAISSNGVEAKCLYILFSIFLTAILPNPYIIYLVLFFFVIYLGHIRNENINISKITIIIIGWLVGNCIINFLCIYEIGLVLFYCVPIILCVYLAKRLLMIQYSDSIKQKLISLMKLLFWIEVVCIPGQYFQKGSYIDLDRIGGTFGYLKGEGMTLLMFSMSFLFLNIYLKNKECLFYFICSALCGTINGCIGLIVFYIITIAFYVLFSINMKMSYKLIFIFCILIIIYLIFKLNDDWVRNDILDLRDPEYLRNRLKKIDMYITTFVDIPRKNWKFAIFGTGMGRYTSRAAMTLTGAYAEWYNNLGLPIINNEYVVKFVVPWLEKAPYNGGIAAAPFAEYITVFGELGIGGLFIFIYLLWKIWKNGNRGQKLLTLFWILICLYNNYFEVGVYTAIFTFTYVIIGILDKNDGKRRIEGKIGYE